MKKLTLVGAAVVSLALVGPAAAAAYVTNAELPTGYHGRYNVTHRMHALDFDHQGFGIAHPTYHSGWGGTYGDGDYPGTVDQNMGPPYWSSH